MEIKQVILNYFTRRSINYNFLDENKSKVTEILKNIQYEEPLSRWDYLVNGKTVQKRRDIC